MIKIQILFNFLVVLFFTGCASLDTYTEYTAVDFQEIEQLGIYHKVEKGQTLWRIATAYGVTIEDIIQMNNIPNVAYIEENQLLFIPGAYQEKEIVVDSGETKDDFVWPVKGKIIRYFHQKDDAGINKGIDIEVDPGQVVNASRSGYVVFADSLVGHGKTIVIDHSDGLYSLYSHNVELLVDLGDYVIKNNEIAKVGKGSDSSHLHFEIRKNSLEDNPLYYLP